jgi:hypothetical protein
MEHIKARIEKLSDQLNSKIGSDSIDNNFKEVLKISQELDKFILKYTKLTTPAIRTKI